MQVVRIGLDLAKYVFEVHGVDGQWNVVIRKTLRRGSVSTFFVAAVALANKNARIVWAMLAGNVSYEPARAVQAA